MTNIIIYDDRMQDVVANAKLEQCATGCTWSEGPVYLAHEDAVLWSDIPNNRIMYWSEVNGLNVWRENVEFTNGHTLDNDGNLLHCSHGLRAIVKTPLVDGKLLASTPDEIIVNSYQGKKLNSPNDLIVDSKGNIWFSDPPYGILSDKEGHIAPIEQDANYVFCFEPLTQKLTAVTDFVIEPNGLAFSPDEKWLYVSDTQAALKENGNHHIVRFAANGLSLTNPVIFAEIDPGLPDGFRIDKQGWIYTSSADSVQILHHDGTLLGKILVPEKVGNLCFGGKNNDVLYIVATSSLYRIKLNTQGAK